MKDNLTGEPETVITLVKETDDWVKYEHYRPEYLHVYPTGVTHSRPAIRKTVKETKYICVGGPFNGQYKCQSQVHDKGYEAFNAAGYSAHSKIYVHEEHLYDTEVPE